MDMNEQDLEILLMLDKYKNITRTAEKLHITQPALTRRIKQMEEKLGVELLFRSRNGVILTPLAESIMPRILELSRGFHDMREYLDSNRGYIGGSLTIGVSINYAQYRLSGFLKKYTELYPKVKIQIRTANSLNIYKALLNQELSLAIMRGEYAWNEGCHRISREPIYIVSMEDFEVDDLRHRNYIRRDTENAFDVGVDRWFQENKLRSSHSIYVDNITTALQMVKEGLGWAIVPQICLDGFEGVKKPIIYQDGSSFLRNSYVLYRNRYYELPQVELFVKELIAYEADLEGYRNNALIRKNNRKN